MSMTKTSVAAAMGIITSALIAQSAAAQTNWIPGNEITGHSVRVEAQGVTNTVYFDPGGAARVVSDGGREYPGRWAVEGQSLCLEMAGARECWPYAAPSMAGQPVALNSTCGPSTWTAVSVMEPPPPPPPMERSGERG
jgi:hypothetical protein